MDPVSLTASILTIITTAEVAVKGLRKLRDVWKAPEDIEDLAKELEILQPTLRDVAAFLESPASSLHCASILSSVERASLIINKIKLTSRPISQSSQSSLSDAARARLFWSRHGNDMTRLKENLKIVRIDLSLQLSLVAAYAFCI